MKKGVNKVILVGNLGQDPKVRYMPNGNAVASITLATSETWKDQQGQQQERTEWHKVIFFRRLAEIAGEYLRKGSKVYLEGKLRTRKWQDNNGQDRYTTEVVAEEMQMLDSRQGGQQQSGGFQGGQGGNQANQQGRHQGNQTRQQNQRPAQQPQNSQSQQQSYTPDLDDGWDDDIPF